MTTRKCVLFFFLFLAILLPQSAASMDEVPLAGETLLEHSSPAMLEADGSLILQSSEEQAVDDWECRTGVSSSDGSRWLICSQVGFPCTNSDHEAGDCFKVKIEQFA